MLYLDSYLKLLHPKLYTAINFNFQMMIRNKSKFTVFNALIYLILLVRYRH